MDKKQQALSQHAQWQGKIEVITRAPLNTMEELAIAYTPGVAEPCLAIQANPDDSYLYTRKGNLVAVITDGTAVLGLGDIGPLASMPVMEGKCALFKRFADVDAIPICVDSKDVDTFVQTVKLISKSFGGINLEDISAPRCFEIEQRLIKECDIPVFHDDQHGTAIVATAALINALKIVNKPIEEIKIVFSGAGASAISCGKLMMALGARHLSYADSKGAIYEGRERLNPVTEQLAKITNRQLTKGTIADLLVGADVLIGLSAPNCITTAMIETMNQDAIVFAMANPTPEIMPDQALAGGAKVVGTGRSDYPNQINNVLAFPGIFKGALQARAKVISEEMKLAAAKAIASLVSTEELHPEYIIPNAFDARVVEVVSQAVADQAKLEKQ
jgi:malate dehydrogenase (oxaloacetate-decarboxylating)